MLSTLSQSQKKKKKKNHERNKNFLWASSCKKISNYYWNFPLWKLQLIFSTLIVKFLAPPESWIIYQIAKTILFFPFFFYQFIPVFYVYNQMLLFSKQFFYSTFVDSSRSREKRVCRSNVQRERGNWGNEWKSRLFRVKKVKERRKKLWFWNNSLRNCIVVFICQAFWIYLLPRSERVSLWKYISWAWNIRREGFYLGCSSYIPLWPFETKYRSA